MKITREKKLVKKKQKITIAKKHAESKKPKIILKIDLLSLEKAEKRKERKKAKKKRRQRD